MAKLLSDADVFGAPPATGGLLSDDDVFGSGQQNQAGGFMPAAKQAIGAGIKGLGQAATDFIPGVEKGNALSSYGQSVIDANQTAIRSLGDIADKPWTAVKEATGNAGGSMASMLGARGVGMAMTAAAPFTGPFAPVVAGAGQLVANVGPFVAAALPSYGGIRGEQIAADPLNEQDARSKAIALLGAGTVGAIEGSFGPQAWALAAMKKGGIEAVAKNFAAAKSLPGFIGKGALKGAAVEGAEELVQNPVEQLASYQDPTTGKNVADTAFSGAMGAIGGGVLGGGMAGVSYGYREQQPTTPQQPAPQPVAPPSGPMGKAAATAQQSGAADAAAMQQAMQDQAAFDEHQARQAKQKGATNEQKAAQGPIEDAGQSISGAPTGLAGQGSEIGASANVGAGQRGRSADSDEVLAGVAPSQTIGQPPIVQPQAEAQDDEAPPRVVVGKDEKGWLNQSAQNYRNQSDNAGLTKEIERLFSTGMTARQVESKIKGRLAFLPKEEITGFVVSVRATLGIPSQMAEEGKAEFAAWQAGYHKRNLQKQPKGNNGTQAKEAEQATQGRPAQPATAANADGNASIAGYPAGEEPANAVQGHRGKRPAVSGSAQGHLSSSRVGGDAAEVAEQATQGRPAQPATAANAAGVAFTTPPQPTTNAGPLPQQAVAMPVPAAPIPTNKQSLSVAPTTDRGVAVNTPDVSTRTDQQLAHLSTNGRNGYKEAAIAEIARRAGGNVSTTTPATAGDSASLPSGQGKETGGSLPKPTLAERKAAAIERRKAKESGGISDDEKQKLLDKKQLYSDMMETKAANGEKIPEQWKVSLSEIDAKLRGDSVGEHVFSLVVEGHPMFDGFPILRNLVPIKVDSFSEAERKLFSAQDLYSKIAGERAKAAHAKAIAKTVAQKKAAIAAMQKLDNNGATEDAVETLRSVTIPELQRIAKEAEQKFGAGNVANDKAKESATKAADARTIAARAPEVASLADRLKAAAATAVGSRKAALEARLARLEAAKQSASDAAKPAAAPQSATDDQNAARKAETIEPWEMTRDEFAEDALNKNEYADAYRKDEKLKKEFLDDQRGAWVKALVNRAEHGRIPDNVLDDFVEKYGLDSMAREFRGVHEKGVEGYLIPDVRNAPRRPDPVRTTWDKEKYERTWAEERSIVKTLDSLPKTPAYWREAKDEHRKAISKANYEGRTIPDKVKSDYPELFHAKKSETESAGAAKAKETAEETKAPEDQDSFVSDQLSRFEAGDFSVPRASANLAGGKSAKDTTEEMNRRYWEAYNDAAKQFLEGDLTAKIPGARAETLRNHELRNVKPKPITKNVGVAKTLDAKLKALAPVTGDKTELRTWLQGVHIEDSGRLVATNGNQMAVVDGVSLDGLPAKPEDDKQFHYTVLGNSGKWLDGRFPDYERVMPTKHATNPETVSVTDLGDYARGVRKAAGYSHSKFAALPLHVGNNKGFFEARLIEAMSNAFRSFWHGEALVSMAPFPGSQAPMLYAVSKDGTMRQAVMGMNGDVDADQTFAPFVVGARARQVSATNKPAQPAKPADEARNQSQPAKLDDANGTIKRPESLNLLANPVAYGDTIQFSDGSKWVAKNGWTGGPGAWTLLQGKTQHPTVAGINGQSEFIRAIIEAGEASKPTVEGGKPAGVYGYSSQPESFQWAAKEVGGAVVYSRGDIALVEGFSPFGNAVYAGVKGDSRTRADISAYTGKMFSETEKAELEKAKADHVKEQGRLYEKAPDGPFSNGARFAKADGVSDEMAGVAQKWLSMLGIKSRVFLATKADVSSVVAIDKYNLRGPFSAIRSAGTQNEADGGKRTLPNGDHYICLLYTSRCV